MTIERNRKRKAPFYAATRVGILIAIGTLVTFPLYTVFSSSSSSRNHAQREILRKEISTKKGDVSEKFSLSLPLFPQAGPPSVMTFAFSGGCTTAQSSFVLGDTVCARVTGGTTFPRRLTFVDPSGFIRQTTTISADPEEISFWLPATQTSIVGNDTVDNRGTWKVNMISSRSSVVTSAQFVVTDPAHSAADLSISKLTSAANQTVSAGSSSTFEIYLINNGPNDAQNVVVTDVVPANTTFGGLVQTSGPSFSCTLPVQGGTGSVSCNRSSLAAGESVTFNFAYQIDSGTPVGTAISNTVTVSSDTEDPNSNDNTATAVATVASTGGSGGGTTCSVGCPDDITAEANTTQSGQDGAIVHFSPPSGNESCGSIAIDHCNDCFFPVGITTVTATVDTGESCSFTVTVNPPNTGGAAIVCPSNVTANADSNCEASVNIGTPVASGTNVTIVGIRSDGKPLYNCDCFPNSPDQQDDACNIYGSCTRRTDLPFAVGITTVTWTAITHDTPGPYATPAEEEAHRTGNASCTQTITVNDVTPPTILAPAVTAAADANCQAAIPDYSSIATVSDNCACSSSDISQNCADRERIVITQSPAAGDLVGLGPHTITLTANDGSSNNGGAGNTTTIQVTFTVNDTTPPTFTFVPSTVVAYTGPDATTCDAVVNDAVLGTATATDNCGPVTVTRSPIGNTFPVGDTTITWTAQDGAGNKTTASQTVTVIDNTPPVIVLNGNAPSLWPPNHAYRTFAVSDFVASVFDNCGGISVSDIVIESVTSDENENGNGDGNTNNDIVVAADCKSVQLRAERSASGDGRVYTITFRLRDTHNNVTTTTALVVVPHNPGETSVNSGVHYTVNGTCP